MDELAALLALASALFVLGLVGVVVRRNLLVMLMCMELMLNGVNLALVALSALTPARDASVLAFLVYVIAAAEIALAIPIVLMLVRRGGTLDARAFDTLRG